MTVVIFRPWQYVNNGNGQLINTILLPISFHLTFFARSDFRLFLLFPFLYCTITQK